MNYKCIPLSKAKIQNLAMDFRDKFGVKELVFPVLDIINDLHCDGLINLLIIENDDNRLSKNELALYELNTNTMYIKLSVYEEALNEEVKKPTFKSVFDALI